MRASIDHLNVIIMLNVCCWICEHKQCMREFSNTYYCICVHCIMIAEREAMINEFSEWTVITVAYQRAINLNIDASVDPFAIGFLKCVATEADALS